MINVRVRLLALALMCCLLVNACATTGESQSPAGVAPATPSADARPTPPVVTDRAVVAVKLGAGIGEPIAPYFAGFSIEAGGLCAFLRVEQSNPAIDHLYNNLGPTIIRIGGSSMNSSVWQPDATCSGVTFGLSTIADVFAFARRANAWIIWGLGLTPSDPAIAADEASAIVALGGDRLIGFEIGNEPNNWTTESAYEQAWEAYVSAIKAQNISPGFVGPSMNDFGGRSWFGAYVQKERSSLSIVTYHYYPLGYNAPSDSAQGPSITHLLSRALMARTARDIDRVVAVAHTNGLPLEIDETNSVNGGGVAGVSDAFASALWMADYLFTAAEHGVLAVNVHGAGGGTPGSAYSPIRLMSGSAGPSVSPLYYGMFLFHLAAGDGTSAPIPATITSAANISVHAILDRSGEIRIALINKDARANVAARVTLEGVSANYEVRYVVRLLAPSLGATSGVTLGGASVRSNGAWVANASSEKIQSSGSSFTISVQRGSAVLVTLTPIG